MKAKARVLSERNSGSLIRPADADAAVHADRAPQQGGGQHIEANIADSFRIAAVWPSLPLGRWQGQRS